jgi:hypothetical protein
MGGSKPSAPTVYMPAPTAPTVYQSIVPEEDYQMLEERLKRIQDQTNVALQQRYKEVGTPEELGARQAGRRVQENAAYLSSLPTNNSYLSGAKEQDQFKAVKEAAGEQLTDSQKEYAKALEAANRRTA